ncbi:MAG: TonB-dependent receptor [Verrucomicrobia bacterium]|nr:TonB-dependent receptor [Verrucomicrobiota bacterium]
MKRIKKSAHSKSVKRQLGVLLSLSISALPGVAQTDTTTPERLGEVVIEGREESMVGIAESASQGTVGAAQLEMRPLSRPGEVLETVPGLILTQHSGAGKANQFFMRGMNLDHGTDFATHLDGMPINMPSHGHGQGYTDLNMLVPELVYRVNYKKGPYYADEGDFSSAGAADMQYYNALPNSIARVEGGSFGYARGLFASSPELGAGHLLYGIELMHNDGPWKNPDNFKKVNGVLRYSQGDDNLGFSITGMAYAGDWDASDQIPLRAVQGGLSRFDTIDPDSGGNSQRYSLAAEWHRADANSATKIMAYGFYYNLDLFSNFTYFLDDPINGDQFHQHDDRMTGGIKASHTWYNNILEREMENTIGLQLRNDFIHNGLFNTVNRQTLNQVREDDVWEVSIAPYVENKTQWAEKFRTVAGVRADIYHFDVDSDNPANSGNETDAIVSPKLSLVFGPWANTEVYLNGGLGFHSNDGRGVTTRIDPATGLAVDPVDPLVRTYGAEIGVRTTWIPNLHSSVSLWWLDIDSELLFIGDAGNTEASRPSRRYGIEFANYYTPLKWLTIDADFSLSHSEFRDRAIDEATLLPVGREIPGSIESVIAAGISVHDLNGFFGSLRLRYFGPRPLVEDNSLRSSETILLSAQVGYQFNKTWTLSAEVFNLLNRKDHEIDYQYESRLAGEPAGGFDDTHFHPVEPISFRVALTATF